MNIRTMFATAAMALTGLIGGLSPCAAETGAALEQQTQRGASYVSGGVGVDEVQAMRAQSSNYNLKLMFAVAGTGEFLANVKVSVQDARGNTVIDAVSDGPLFYARLPEGRYRVVTENDGKTQSRAVTLRSGQRADLNFFWPSGEYASARPAKRKLRQRAPSATGVTTARFSMPRSRRV